MKYAVIPNNMETGEFTVDDITVIEVKDDSELMEFMEQTWDRGIPAPTIISLVEISKLLTKRALTLKEILRDE